MNQKESRNQAYALKDGEGWIYQFGVDFVVKASEIQANSGVSFLEYTTSQGEEPPMHSHPTENEMFYVLAGEITFQCGDETFDLEKGGFVFLPAGVRHGYIIRSAEPVRLIAVASPIRESSGGWGGFVSDMELGQGELIAKPPHVE